MSIRHLSKSLAGGVRARVSVAFSVIWLAHTSLLWISVALCQPSVFGQVRSGDGPARSAGLAKMQLIKENVGWVIAEGKLLLSVNSGRRWIHGWDPAAFRTPDTPQGSTECLQSGRLVGRVLDLVYEKPIRKAKIEILRQPVEVLSEGSYLIHSIDESVPLGITAYTDDTGLFEITVPLRAPPNYFVVVVQAPGFHKIEQMLTLVVPNKATTIGFDLIPTRPTRAEMKVIEKKLDLRRRKLATPKLNKQP